MTVGERIHLILHEKGIKQLDFCQKTGIPQSTVSEWKGKKICPSADKVLKICKALEISPYELLQDTQDSPVDRVPDYLVVSEGTEGYELLIEFQQLSDKNKSRLMGYLASLKQE